MITQLNFANLLLNIGFIKDKDNNIYFKEFENNSVLKVDFSKNKLIYPEQLRVSRDTTKDFHQNENFVVFECINNLFEKGYKPENLFLEKVTPNGRQNVAGFCDIVVQDNKENEYLIIECKTASNEYDKAWKDVLEDGGQLFNYYNSFRKAKYLCLYTSDYKDNNRIIDYKVISMNDNEEYLQANKKLKLVSFKDVRERNGNKEEYFQVWKDTYQLEYNTKGIFEKDVAIFSVGSRKYNIDDLIILDNESMQKKYNEFATILRKHNVSGKENAFDKLVNLFLVKVVDETTNPSELKFYWKGVAYDDDFSFQDRLQGMYKIGMEKYLKEDVTYYDNKEIQEVFEKHKKHPDAIEETILQYFRELKFYSNNAFAFLDVHNEQLFMQNAKILKEVVQMLQDIKLNTEEQNQFLGDLFEGFLDQGVKQSEGQFFTPLPIVRFLVSSLPIEQIIKDSPDIPLVIDYACGAGHFLNEYANQIKPYVEKYKNNNLKEYYKQIYGIEKESRLSKVSKVACFMYNQNDINIIYADALSNKPKEMGIRDNTFSVLIANPPYSVKGFLETLNETELQNYELTKKITKISTNNSIETFFIERAKQLLKPNGVAAIILPSSFLTNGDIYIYAREILLKYFDIIAISVFESGTFGKTGTSTISLFIRRKAENPNSCDLLFDRVEAWFNNDTTNDAWYKDTNLINEYCNLLGYNIEDYKTLLTNNPNENLLGYDMFKMYEEIFQDDTNAKTIKNKKTRKNRKDQRLCTDEQIEKELKEYIIESIREVEKQKLYYFLLAKDNPQKVLISKSPTDKTNLKKFLGYEWSNTKGKEGIKYLGVTTEGELSKNKGILNIQTSLFNPKNLTEDNDKINSLVRNNFLNKQKKIPGNLKEYVSYIDLVDMLDFSKVNFDKQIRLTKTEKISIESKYPLKSIEEYVNTIQTGSRPKGGVGYLSDGVLSLGGEHIDNTNGYLNLASPKYVTIEYYKSFNSEKVKVEKNDILLCKDGALTGKVAIVRDELSNKLAMINEHVFILRCDDLNKQRYLFEFLFSNVGQNILKANITGSAQGGLNSHNLKNIQIPAPDSKVIEQIVKECEQVDKEYNSSRMSIEEYKNKISQVFEKLEVIIHRGGKKVKTIKQLLLQIKESSIKIPQDEILLQGKYPVVTQEAERLIAGYTNKENPITNVPYIVFGDHSCTFKYIDFPFFRGAEGTQLIKTNENEIKLKYLYEYLLTLKIPNADKYERHFKYLKDMQVIIPSQDIQQQVIGEITKYRKEISKHEEIMQSCKAKKQAILDKYLL